MPTRWSQTLIPTARNVPAEAEVPSHQLMLRAGFIRKLGAGVYDYLPLGQRSLRKVMGIIRQEMEAAGAVEVFLPTLIPVEMFQATGRRAAYGDNLFVIKDRADKEYALGPTHEEVITELVGAFVESYKQLPLTLYQIQTKFRDEERPRYGVLRSREFQMKDAYSWHLSVDGPGGLNETYDKQYAAYERIFKRCGLPYLTVEAESGPIGGSASHEFMVPSPTGEDTILESDKGNYAANVEKCEIGDRSLSEDFAIRIIYRVGAVRPTSVPQRPPTGDLKRLATPDADTIETLCARWPKFAGGKLKAKNVLKTIVLAGHDLNPPAEFANVKHLFPMGHPVWIILAVVRGDHEVNIGKVKTLISSAMKRSVDVQVMGTDTARQLGIAMGYVGPGWLGTIQDGILRGMVRLFIDFDAAQQQFWVVGGNEPGVHLMHFDWSRDFLESNQIHPDVICVAGIRNAIEGDPSPKNDGGVLHVRKGIEIGHVFKLGDKYTRAMNITVLNEKNERQHPLMGCYGIGVNRILAAAIERKAPGMTGHDENGIIWPAAIAPYSVLITPIRYDGAMKDTADKLAVEIEGLGRTGSALTRPDEIGTPSPGRPDPRIGSGLGEVVDVLIDDRDERPGVKFKDADLLGIPVRITIGEKSLAEGKVEIKARNGSSGGGEKGELIPLDQAAARVIALLATV